MFRAPSGYGTVELTIVDSEWSVPSSTLIASVQNAVDPLTDQGSGIGFAPIGHTVTVSGVTGRTINTKFKLTLENNVSWSPLSRGVSRNMLNWRSKVLIWRRPPRGGEQKQRRRKGRETISPPPFLQKIFTRGSLLTRDPRASF